MLASIPLLIVPFILYNLGLAGLYTSGSGSDIWATELFSVKMISGGTWTMTLSDAMLVVALVLLFVEIIKSTRTSSASLVDHLLSALVFIAFLIEFLLVDSASTSLFFLLTVISLFDLLAGFTVSLRVASRDVTIG